MSLAKTLEIENPHLHCCGNCDEECNAAYLETITPAPRKYSLYIVIGIHNNLSIVIRPTWKWGRNYIGCQHFGFISFGQPGCH